MYFSAGLSFYLSTDEQPQIKAEALRHITSTATAYCSLRSCPEDFRYANDSGVRSHKAAVSRPDIDVLGLDGKAQRFADGILALKLNEWISDESARVYCECRALPFAIDNATAWHSAIDDHIRHALAQLDPTKSDGRVAVGEASPERARDEWYPPNAYHTFWALKALACYKDRYRDHYNALDEELHLSTKIVTMRQWARQVLAFQTSLHSAHSSTSDSDQLAWALAIICADPLSDQSRLDEQDFIRQAFHSLFGTQTDVGTWRHYAPLFHYKKSGNAYCYVFETFAALLDCALNPNATFLRTVLAEHCTGLMKLWSYAIATRQSPTTSEQVLIWSSGHRLNQHWPESWATASVFEYAEALRRLIGIWTREAAIQELPTFDGQKSKDSARGVLEKRSTTWTSGNGLTDRLFTLFVYPRDRDLHSEGHDPDAQLIRDDSARSAILFGPAGASKTTIIRHLAASIGWHYVELHSSHFVTDGLLNVQRTADRIFQRLYELDHAVILFDEVDELVRERELEGESSGRFLTTSMLPKLAELWGGRRVLYFVATNHIEFFDKAITRAQRFDAVWFVSPPSFESKKAELERLLSRQLGRTVSIPVPKSEIEESLQRLYRRLQPASSPALSSEATKSRNLKLMGGLEKNESLAKLILLRWDELPELALRIKARIASSSAVDRDMLGEALSDVNDGRWRTVSEYIKFVEDQKFERRDYGKLNLWRTGTDSAIANIPNISSADGVHYLEIAVEDWSELSVSGFKITRLGPGTIDLHEMEDLVPEGTPPPGRRERPRPRRSSRGPSH